MFVSERVRGPEGEAAGGRDLRVVPLALAAWAAAWAGTGFAPGAMGSVRLWMILVGAVGSGALLLGVLARPRCGSRMAGAWLLGTLLVALAVGVVGALQAHRLRSGPVAELARQQAVVTATLELRSDARLLAGAAGRPPVLLTDARLDQVAGRGTRWRVRSPVTVLASGSEVAWWSAQPVGTTVLVSGRLQSPKPGEDVAAVLRVRAPPTAVGPPGAGLGWSSGSDRDCGSPWPDAVPMRAPWSRPWCSATPRGSPRS